jgi:hypothetical protein
LSPLSASVIACGILLAAPLRRARAVKTLSVLSILLLMLLMISCGGGNGTSSRTGALSAPETQPGTYQITITGNSAGLAHSTQLGLTIR